MPKGEDTSAPDTCVQRWLILSRFKAQAVALGLLDKRWAQELVVDIPEGLECDLPYKPEMKEDVMAACNELTYLAAEPLLAWAMEYSPTERAGLEEISRGPAYTGPPFLCMDRWRFWRNRLESLAKDESNNISEDVRKAAAAAAKEMREAEMKVPVDRSGLRQDAVSAKPRNLPT